MWLAVGYLLLVAIAAVLVFMTIHEERRKYLVSPVGPMETDDLPPYSPFPLLGFLVAVGILVLFDAAFVTLMLPTVLLNVVEGGTPSGPGATVHLLNLAFDLLVLKVVWASWRRRRVWLALGMVLSWTGIFLVLMLGADELPRWHAGRFVGSHETEVRILTYILIGWFLFAIPALLRPREGQTGLLIRDEELADCTEPLTEPERVRVRWARGELTDGERDAVLVELAQAGEGDPADPAGVGVDEQDS